MLDDQFYPLNAAAFTYNFPEFTLEPSNFGWSTTYSLTGPCAGQTWIDLPSSNNLVIGTENKITGKMACTIEGTLTVPDSPDVTESTTVNVFLY